MTGKKGMVGSGGQRKNAGRPRRNLQIDKERARKLTILTRYRSFINPAIKQEEDLLGLLIDAEWEAFNEDVNRNAEIALEGEREYLEKEQK